MKEPVPTSTTIKQNSEKRILIIEDNLDSALFLSMIIENSGIAKTSSIQDGLEGLAYCFASPPDAVVLDLELPTMRGEDVCRLIRASRRHRKMPIVICSELDDAKRREMELLRMGADAYFQKPVPERLFLRSLRELLAPPGSDGSQAPLSGSSPRNEQYSFIAAAMRSVLKDEPEPPRRQDPLKAIKEATTATAPGRARTNDKPSALFAPTSLPPNNANPPPSAGQANVATAKDEYSRVAQNLYQGYRILDVIGSGGMGTVYKAEQMSLQRVVALKVLLEHHHRNHEIRSRFQREAMIMAQINHPNIVQVYDIGQTAFTSYFSMEYVSGSSLYDLIRDAALAREETQRIFSQMCDAISHLHGKGIIHRDIKPSNILISSEGNVKVTDFGISRARLMVDRREFTQILQFMGTPEFMAPELHRLQPANEKTDQFALGITLWRMLAGVTQADYGAPLHQIRPDVPRALSDAVARSLANDPDARYPSIQALKEAVLRVWN